MANKNLFTLLQINDSMFPIGGFTHSYGLESYVNADVVKDDESASAYVEMMLRHNIFFNDAAFVNLAWKIANNKQAIQKIKSLDEMVTALKSPAEISNASKKLAIRFLKLTAMLEQHALCQNYYKAVENGEMHGHYPIAFALYAKASGITIVNALTGFYYNAINAIVTNCAKMVPISQNVAQQILYNMTDLVDELVQKRNSIEEDEIGVCCVGQEIKCMQHENEYSRIYIS